MHDAANGKPEDWLARLAHAYRAGYYRTEAARDQQSGFPWQNKTCSDCPFWSNRTCYVFGERRSPMAHTCSYFDCWNREAARRIVLQRLGHDLSLR
jgi:hypothetical protein